MARTGRKTDYVWNGVGFGATLAAGGTLVQDITGLIGNSGTLYRSRGELVASIDGPTDGDKVEIAMGIMRVTQEQLAVGATSIPSPRTDLDADWLWHGWILLMSQGVGELSGNVTMAQRLTIDSKAMRKFRQGESFAFVLKATNVAGTPAFDILAGIRVLIGT